MAQIYLPEHPRERDQLQSSVSAPDMTVAPRSEERPSRRLGFIDAAIALVVLSAVTLLVLAASRWAAPLTPAVHIQLGVGMLPVYAGYSLLRMLLAYLLSLIFTLIYGHIAATNRRAETVMVPILDILQSIPILSFLPAVVLALVAAFPHSNVGLELASGLLIFTSQAWNMTFSFYHSARTLPADLKEVSAIARLRPWQRFFKLEVPSSMIGLIWNSMMSWAGGWFFLMASEQFVLGDRSFQLPGLGSYLQVAANTGDTVALLLGLGTLIVLIVLLDVVFWRPLVAWADKFKLEVSSEAEPPTSPVLSLLRRSTLVAAITHRLFRPIGDGLAHLLNRVQPVGDRALAGKAGRAESCAHTPHLGGAVPGDGRSGICPLEDGRLARRGRPGYLGASTACCGCHLVAHAGRARYWRGLDAAGGGGDWPLAQLFKAVAAGGAGRGFHSRHCLLSGAAAPAGRAARRALAGCGGADAAGNAVVHPV